MALANRAELVASIKAWLKRTKDPQLAERVDDLLALAEASFDRSLRTPWLLARFRGTLHARWLPLPDDCLHVMTVWRITPGETHPVALDYHSPDDIARIAHRPGAAEDVPVRYTIIGRDIGFFPQLEPWNEGATTQYDLVYYRRGSRLVGDEDSNLTLLRYPGIYLYGTLRQAAPYLRDDPAIAIWDAAYGDALDAANSETEALIGGPLRMRLE